MLLFNRYFSYFSLPSSVVTDFVDEFIRVCTGYASSCEISDQEGCGKRFKRDCIEIFMAYIWEFDLGDGDVFIQMVSRTYSGAASSLLRS